MKEVITTAQVLKYFDQTKPTKVSSDFSGEGLGALLEQQFEDEWHPIAYASRTLTAAERNYSPLEGEMLSIVLQVKDSMNTVENLMHAMTTNL